MNGPNIRAFYAAIGVLVVVPLLTFAGGALLFIVGLMLEPNGRQAQFLSATGYFFQEYVRIEREARR